jgi:hypothetical protein
MSEAATVPPCKHGLTHPRICPRGNASGSLWCRTRLLFPSVYIRFRHSRCRGDGRRPAGDRFRHADDGGGDRCPLCQGTAGGWFLRRRAPRHRTCRIMGAASGGAWIYRQEETRRRLADPADVTRARGRSPPSAAPSSPRKRLARCVAPLRAGPRAVHDPPRSPRGSHPPRRWRPSVRRIAP